MDAEIQAMDGNQSIVQVLDCCSFPSSRSRRYTQVPSDQKRRHSGRDCRNPEAMEGKLADEQVFDSGNFQPAVSHPCGLDA